jgi:hypothetical protein
MVVIPVNDGHPTVHTKIVVSSLLAYHNTITLTLAHGSEFMTRSHPFPPLYHIIPYHTSLLSLNRFQS